MLPGPTPGGETGALSLKGLFLNLLLFLLFFNRVLATLFLPICCDVNVFFVWIAPLLDVFVNVFVN